MHTGSRYVHLTVRIPESLVKALEKEVRRRRTVQRQETKRTGITTVLVSRSDVVRELVAKGLKQDVNT